jgi:hypothetical protein
MTLSVSNITTAISGTGGLSTTGSLSAAGASLSSIPANATFSSLGEMKSAYPTLYNTIMNGLAQTMITQMQADNDNLVAEIEQEKSDLESDE